MYYVHVDVDVVAVRRLRRLINPAGQRALSRRAAVMAPPDRTLTAMAAAAILHSTAVLAYTYDVVLPGHTPWDCFSGRCANWSEMNGTLQSYWGSPRALAGAGTGCAMPAKAVQGPLSKGCSGAGRTGYALDGWCMCDTAGAPNWTQGSWSWCKPPPDAPTQINLLVINSTALAVNFVTFASDGGVPVAELRRKDGSGATASITGFTTEWTGGPGAMSVGRTDFYHHCVLSALDERTAYEYRVATSIHRNWTEWTGFTSLYSDGVTKVAMYGDMGPPFGLALGHNTLGTFPAPMPIGNIIDDVKAGRVNWIVHAGDHAYEFPVNSGQRGDGYMDLYQPLLEQAPWAPGWGNHEYLEADRGNRLLNITAGMIRELGSRRHHSAHQQQGAATPAAAAASTAQWYSVKIGLMHLIMLDLDPYMLQFAGCKKVDNCGYMDRWSHDGPNATDDSAGNFSGYRSALLTWLEAELKAVNRSQTPWLVLSSHFPLASYSTRQHDPERDAAEPDKGGWGGWGQAASQPFPPPPPHTDAGSIHWKETEGLNTCEGSNYAPPHDPWGTGNDGVPRCPLLPTNWTAAQQVAACKQVCVAGGFDCAGFVVYGPHPPTNNTECCFRGDTSQKPKCAGHGGAGACSSCFEKMGMGPRPARPSAAQASADLEPLMLTYGVDMYFAGHAHFYETTWPVANGVTTQKSYADISHGVVHVT